jgi:NAD(P)-dependent dehydrogenase (short-subunit alcohol dehydrogenase family)
MKISSLAIVTGASQGIGQATALRLARDFSVLILAARNESELQKTATAVRSAGAEPVVYALDLREPSSAEILIKGTLDCFGRIDALLNIAGAVRQIDLFEMTDEEWKAGMELKLHGARRLTIRAWQALKASKGSVVFMSGSAALDPKPALCRRSIDQCSDHCTRQSIRRARDQGRRSGQQHRARCGHYGTTALLSGEMGTRAQHKRRRGDEEVPRRSRH